METEGAATAANIAGERASTFADAILLGETLSSFFEALGGDDITTAAAGLVSSTFFRVSGSPRGGGGGESLSQ